MFSFVCRATALTACDFLETPPIVNLDSFNSIEERARSYRFIVFGLFITARGRSKNRRETNIAQMIECTFTGWRAIGLLWLRAKREEILDAVRGRLERLQNRVESRSHNGLPEIRRNEVRNEILRLSWVLILFLH